MNLDTNFVKLNRDKTFDQMLDILKEYLLTLIEEVKQESEEEKSLAEIVRKQKYYIITVSPHIKKIVRVRSTDKILPLAEVIEINEKDFSVNYYSYQPINLKWIQGVGVLSCEPISKSVYDEITKNLSEFSSKLEKIYGKK